MNQYPFNRKWFHDPNCPAVIDLSAKTEGREFCVIGENVYEADANGVLTLRTGAAGSGWRPIGTAPKDGRAILIYEPKGSMGRIREEWGGVRFDDRRYAVGYWRVWNQEGGWGNRNCAFVNPTHWMPLPAPPKRKRR